MSIARLSVVSRIAVLVAVFFGGFLSGREAAGQTVTWVGTGANASWHLASNWSPAVVPGPTDDVIIPAGSGSVLISSTDVTVATLNVGRPLSISGSRSLFVASATVTSSLSLAATCTLSGGSYAFSTGGVLSFPSPCTAPGRLTNVTITGTLDSLSGHSRWNNVTLNGSVTATATTYIVVDGPSTINGTLFNNTSNLMSFGGIGTSPTLTIGSGGTLRGDNIEFIPSARCLGGGGLSLVNRGTIEGTAPSRPVVISVPFLNLGTLLGAINNNGQQFGTNWTVATPSQNAFADTPRPDPGSGSTQTLTYQNLYIAPNTPFHLGSGETLNLNNGNGTLYINQGAVFYGNGTVLGNIFNAGLLIIPITQAGLVFNVQGPGVIIITPPTVRPPGQPPVVIPIPPQGPPVIGSGSYVSIGGSGFGGTNGGGGGGGGIAPGHYVIPGTGPTTVRGTVAWDGQLDVTGSYTQTPTGVLRMFIAGTTQGQTYSFLNVGQAAGIDGSLQIVLQPELFNYLPQVGNSFDLITAAGGLTLTSGSINVTSLMTAQGAAFLGLSLPAFNSGFANDPNQLVSLPQNLFSYSIVNGTTLRVTMTQSVSCSTPITPANRLTCPTGGASFTTGSLSASPATYQWQYRGAGAEPPLEWTDLVDGQNDFGSGVVLSVTGATTPTVALQRVSGSWNGLGSGAGGSLRSVVTNVCGSGTSAPAMLSICKADMTCDNSISVQDIFSFLGAWFGGQPAADFNGVDGVTVQDIFDYLAAWFQGC